jgi:hypothetical protein
VRRHRTTTIAAFVAFMVLLGVTPSSTAATGRPAVGSAPAASPPLPAATLQGADEGGIEVGPPLPAPSPPSTGKEVEAGKASHPGFFDIPGQIENAINEWFAGLVRDALDPAMVLVGRLLLSTPEIVGQASVRSYWQLSLGIADSLLVLVIIVAGALVMAHESLQTRYALKDVLPRLLLAGILTNASLAISGQMVNIANALASGFLGDGVDPEQAGRTLEHLVLNAIAGGGIFLVLLGLACAVLAVGLLVLYLIRAAAIVFLVGAAPVCLLAHGLPQTEGLARLWWRLMFALLGVQVAQALVLAGAVHVFFASGGHGVLGVGTSGGLIDLLIALCLFWVLLRIPFWAKEIALSGRHSSAARMVKTYVTYRVVRGALGGIA